MRIINSVHTGKVFGKDGVGVYERYAKGICVLRHKLNGHAILPEIIDLAKNSSLVCNRFACRDHPRIGIRGKVKRNVALAGFVTNIAEEPKGSRILGSRRRKVVGNYVLHKALR